MKTHLGQLQADMAHKAASFEQAKLQHMRDEADLRLELMRRQYYLPHPKLWKIAEPLRLLKTKLERYWGGFGRP